MTDKQAQRLSDARIQAIWDDACHDTPKTPGWNRHIRYARAIEAAIVPEGYVVVKADPVAWDVYNPEADNGYLVDSQDDPQLVDDMTNCEGVTVTPLYAAKE